MGARCVYLFCSLDLFVFLTPQPQVLETIEAGKRLQAPSGSPPWCGQLMAQCFELAPEARPTFKAILETCSARSPL